MKPLHPGLLRSIHLLPNAVHVHTGTARLRAVLASVGLAPLMRLALLAAVVLGTCGVGFWWLEPRALSFSDGLWLAFTTAATVGYGDIVPTTSASKIFAVFVVLLGYAMISLLTAAIAAMWVGSQERRIEREILRDMHRQLDALRHDLAALKREPPHREAD